MPRRIYISATKLDLDDYRKHVAEIIRKWGDVDVAMEHYVADTKASVDKCIADVQSCDLYILLVALRYG